MYATHYKSVIQTCDSFYVEKLSGKFVPTELFQIFHVSASHKTIIMKQFFDRSILR